MTLASLTIASFGDSPTQLHAALRADSGKADFSQKTDQQLAELADQLAVDWQVGLDYHFDAAGDMGLGKRFALDHGLRGVQAEKFATDFAAATLALEGK